MIKFLGVFKEEETGATALVTEFIDMKGSKFKELCKKMTPYEMRFYMY